MRLRAEPPQVRTLAAPCALVVLVVLSGCSLLLLPCTMQNAVLSTPCLSQPHLETTHYPCYVIRLPHRPSSSETLLERGPSAKQKVRSGCCSPAPLSSPHHNPVRLKTGHAWRARAAAQHRAGAEAGGRAGWEEDTTTSAERAQAQAEAAHWRRRCGCPEARCRGCPGQARCRQSRRRWGRRR